MIHLDTVNVVILFASIANIIFGMMVYARNRKSATNKTFFFLSLSIALWGVAMLAFRSTTSPEFAQTLATLLYASAALIPLFSVRFARTFPRDSVPWGKLHELIVAIPFIIAAAISLTPNLLITGVMIEASGEPTIQFNTTYHLIYVAYIALYFLWAQIALIARYIESNRKQRAQLFYIISGTAITIFVAGTTNLFMPLFGIFYLNWAGQIATTSMTGLIAYGVLRHHMFNVRVLSTEILMFSLWVMIFINIVIAETVQEKFFNLGIFSLIVVTGLLLVRSVIKEVEARDKIQELAEHLEDANVRLKELDRQKSEFLSMAAHQLRTPLTSIKGYASLMLEGSYGDMSDKVDGVMETIFASSSRMVDTVSDFLNVSRIEQGKMDYRMVYTDLGNLAKSVVTELALSAKEKKLELNYHDDGKGPYSIHADISKLEHVISNLVDNAIKYTPKGAVSVRVEKDSMRNMGVVKVVDTGAGIPAEALPKLFDKFVRARNAHEINVTGTGLGLYVAREMMYKHNGKIWAESKGEGKGSTFVVEIPLAEKGS